eukprot:GILI01010458.1.p1 GENE.GILI01010458.1~~GILI01010458.1.p1  ORF type:complete len:404 (-),score=27.08 GILI01010458.1:229-1386(-)
MSEGNPAFVQETGELPVGITRKLKSKLETLREKHHEERKEKHSELKEEWKKYAVHENNRTFFEHIDGNNTYEKQKSEANEPYMLPPPGIEEPNRCIAMLSKVGLRHGVILHGFGDTKRNSNREKVARFIHGKKFQVVVVVLLLADVCLVIAELILQSYQVCEFHIERERCEEPPAGAFPLIEEEFENSNGFFAPTGCGAFADATMPHNIHKAEVVLMWFSRAILIFFTLEILTTLFCLGRRFFTILYLLDFVVVVTSLILSFVFDGNTEAEAESAVIIFLRCWRFARVLHGFGVTIHTAEVQHEHDLKAKQELLESEEEAASSPAMDRECLDQMPGLHPYHRDGIQSILDLKAAHRKELEDLCESLQIENEKLKSELDGEKQKNQ